MTPTQRSLAHLRKWGYIAAVVEKWNPHARIRQDAFGFGDILATNPESCTRAARAALAKSPYDPTQAFADIVLVQTTTDSNLSARAKKIEGLEAARSWLLAGGRIELHG